MKRCLSNESIANKQHIRPSLVKKALEKLVGINPFYKQIRLDDFWEDISKESDPELREFLTDKKTKSEAVEGRDSKEDADSTNFIIEN